MDRTNAALLLGWCPVCGDDMPCKTPADCRLEAAIEAMPQMADVLRVERQAQEVAMATRRSDVRYQVRQCAYANAVLDANEKRDSIRATLKEIARIQGLAYVYRVTESGGRYWCHGVDGEGREVIMIARSEGVDRLCAGVVS